ncbi:MAG: NAD-dependent malic enzyme [Clostridiales bacterium]|nr:MAG: NAD-dependent malic enzyme [Clostridiales bacterium]
MKDYNKMAIEMHEKHKGKITVVSKVKVEDKDALSTAYTPGVAEPCRKIHENPDSIYTYTSKGNMVAVVTDGSAVLGLGDIGADAALPVMEGKAVLFKEFGGVDAFPVCIKSNEVDEIVRTVELLEPVFGGINLEDISAPRCFEIERKLKEIMDIPVFHDDQHGTAIVVLAGIINALKIVGKNEKDMRVVVNGAGAAGTAITKLLLDFGFKDLVMCDSKGIICKGDQRLNWAKKEIAEITNLSGMKGDLAKAMEDSDIFIGVSAPGIVTKEMISSMKENAIVFAMANPVPEIMPDLAKEGGARVIGTGRSDFPNQVNNVLAFPAIFRGTLDVRASDINEAMKIAAARAIASVIDDSEINEDNILPKPFDKRIMKSVSEAVMEAARASGVARI